jgi:hypothetical protein
MPQLPPTPVDIALEMAKILKSTIIAACPRVGKGVVVSKAIAFLKQLYPDLEIWLIDPKDEPSELHYWLAIDLDKRCHFDLRPYDADIKKATQTFEAFLIRFNGSNSSRKLLIIDEFVMLNQKCDSSFMTRLKDFLVGICSSGELSPDQALGRFVWVITQSPFTKDLGFKTRAAISTFQRVFLLNTASIQLYSIAMSAGFIPNQPEKEITEMLSVTGRVFYYSRSNSWHPVPNYELPSPSQNQPKIRVINAETKQIVHKEPLTNKETVELKVSDNLAEPLKTIWLYCKEQGDWVTTKKMYQASKAVLKGKSVEQIRQYFGILSDRGYGEIDEEGKSPSAVVFRAY